MRRGRGARRDVYLGDDDSRSALRRYAAPAAALVVLAGFSAIVWYAYDRGVKSGADAVAPHIRADTVATKRAPEQPGGDVAPHEGIYVYNPVGINAEPPEVERLLPPPETPLPRPAPLAERPAEPLTAEPAPAPPAPAVPGELSISPPIAQAEPVPAADVAAEIPAPAEVAVAPSPSPKPALPPGEGADIQRVLENLQRPQAEPAAGPGDAPQVAAIPPARAWRVQVASLGSREAAERAWTDIRRAHGAVLGTLEADYRAADIPGRGTFYRLQVGPLPDQAAASALCATLQARDQGCLVVRP